MKTCRHNTYSLQVKPFLFIVLKTYFDISTTDVENWRNLQSKCVIIVLIKVRLVQRFENAVVLVYVCVSAGFVPWFY